MARKSHPAEQTWDERVVEQLESLEYVEHVHLDGGERDYIAGQRDVDRMTWVVKLDESTIQQIEFVEGADEFSETLRGVRNDLELELGLAPGDSWMEWDEMARGTIYVTGTHDNRPGGSDVFR